MIIQHDCRHFLGYKPCQFRCECSGCTHYSGIVKNCDLLVTGDTLALHLAIGLKAPVVVMFGPTRHQEIEIYGRGTKIASDFECSPCYLGVCQRQVTCMDAISVDAVIESAARLVKDLRLTIED